MTDQHPKMIIDDEIEHPLTDEIANEIYPHDPDGHEYYCGSWKVHMQAGANWQLEQVIDWLRHNLHLMPTSVNYIVENLREAMRPQEDD